MGSLLKATQHRDQWIATGGSYIVCRFRIAEAFPELMLRTPAKHGVRR